MQALTPEERRGAVLVVALLLIGAGHDAWRSRAPGPHSPPVAGIRPAATRTDAALEGGPPTSPISPAPADSGLARLDLNRATEAQLDGLPGIGPVLARRIVDHRSHHGAFHHIEELRAIRGVGPRLLERLRPLVRAAP